MCTFLSVPAFSEIQILSFNLRHILKLKKLFFLILLISVLSVANAQQKPKADTTKPKQSYDLVLIGKVEDLQLFLKAVHSPGEMTRNQIAYLDQWAKTAQKMVADTTKRKK